MRYPSRRWWCPCALPPRKSAPVRSATNGIVRAVLSTFGTLAPSSLLLAHLAVRCASRTLHAAPREYRLRCMLHPSCTASCPVQCTRPRASCIVHPASCARHVCTLVVNRRQRTEGCRCMRVGRVQQLHAMHGGWCCLAVANQGERRMLLMVAPARTTPRLGWGTRRHSATSAASVPGQQRPS